MPITVRKRKGEHFNAMLYRFNKRVRQSGILYEARKRRFFVRPESKNRRRSSALYRVKKSAEIRRLRRYGHLPVRRGRR